ncbi:MAG: glycosyltransferase family 4 protein [Candidatus Harrisonbacteria bacterium]|nr:glycosyltransferase family 4 protein [Candidatus Harrisonbacteria bacterium]
MRIIFFTTKLNFETGGYSTPELDLKLRTMKALGHDVRVITLFPGINRGALPSAYPVIEERVGTSGQIAIQLGVRRILKKYERDADVFHVDGTVFLYGAGLYRFLGGKIPVLAGLNREQSSFPPFRPKRERFSFTRFIANIRRNIRYATEKTLGVFLANHIDLFTFCSPMLRDLYIRFGLQSRKCVFNYDFLDAEEALTHKRGSRQRHGRPFAIFTAGRMVWEKGLDLALVAVAKLRHKDGVRLIVGGDGPELGTLKKLADTLGIAGITEFTGWLPMDKLFAYMNEADCFVSPCWRPEIGSALAFHAMSVGVPNIVPAGGGLEWFVGGASATFRAFDTDDLAKKIALLMNDEALGAALTEKGFTRVKELDYHEPAKILDKMLREIARA